MFTGAGWTARVRGWGGVGWAEIVGGIMFHPGNPARGGFSLGSLVASMRSRRHLASWNATEQRECPLPRGGRVMVESGGINQWMDHLESFKCNTRNNGVAASQIILNI